MQNRLRLAVGVFLAVLVGACISGASLAAPRTLSVNDILRLHGAGVDEDVIMSEIVVTDTVFELDVDEILGLQEAGVSDRLLQFMVDTGRGDLAANPAAEDVEAFADEPLEQAYVEEAEVTQPVVHASLRWSYPVWWYDMYWYDYWYYDCHYDPWSISWTYPCGVWYPTWYWSSRCWAPSAWGYRHRWWTGGGYAWNSWHDGAYDWRGSHGFHDGSPLALSDHKYKAGSGNGKLMVAGSGLRTRDGTRVEVDAPIRIVSRKEGLAVDTHREDVRRPVRTGGKSPATRGDTIRRPAQPQVRPAPDRDAIRPVRPVRTPAPGDRPVKRVVRRTESSPSSPVVRPPPPPATGRADAPDKPEGGKKVKPAPAPRPEPVPAVESRPAPKSSSPSPPPSRSGNKASPEPRGGKTRSR